MTVLRFRLPALVIVLTIFFICSSSRTLAAQASPENQAPGLVSPADNSIEPPDTTVRTARVQWRQLFNSGNWTELDAVANQLRSQRLRFQGGAWQLNVFYNTVGPAGQQTASDAAWETQIARLQEWAQAEPASATPRIALADAYLAFAWKARGNGFANTVAPDGWTRFRQRVQKARTTLESAAQLNSGDPEWYRAMQTVALAQGWNREQVDALVDQALNKEPGYFAFAVAESNYLLPKWYGKAGETEEFAARVADRIGGPEGDATYFLIAARINCCRKTQAPAIAWARVRQGYAALEQLYGTNLFERNALAYLALKAGDGATAQAAFAKIGDDWDAIVWRSKPRFNASRLGHPMGDVQPVQPDATTQTESSNSSE